MSKRKTISTRWKEWALSSTLDWWLSHIALISFLSAMIGLFVHLWVLEGIIRTTGLVVLIVGDSITLTITGIRKQWWWFTFFCYITIGVIGWEIASYFFGS